MTQCIQRYCLPSSQVQKPILLILDTFIYKVVPPAIEPLGWDLTASSLEDTSNMTTGSLVESVDASLFAKLRI